jgi:hypothetical protein
VGLACTAATVDHLVVDVVQLRQKACLDVGALKALDVSLLFRTEAYSGDGGNEDWVA